MGEKKKIVSFFVFSFLVFLVYGLVLGWGANYSDVKELMDRAERIRKERKDLEANGTFIENLKKKGESKARELYEYYQGKEFQKKVEEYKARLKSIFNETYGIDFNQEEEPERYYVDYWKGKRKGVFLEKGEKIYVFVSSSMGEDVVKKYVKDSVLIFGEVYFVLRGGISGLTYLSPTAKWILNVLKVDNFCDIWQERCRLYNREFLIDPLLFRKFEIKKVPVVVYVRGELDNPSKVIISPGAVSLKRHLSRIGQVLQDQRFSEENF
ncbi:MAG: TrbC family F-type conjugative pilus assembly protein [bacterium]|jgi:hypothetical protein